RVMNKVWILILGPVVAAALGMGLFASGFGNDVAWTAAVTAICAIWWVFEPIPIAATSLIPLAVLPLVGVLPASQVSAAYGNKLILLMLGGFILSTAMERSGAHRRIALGMVSLFGGSNGRRLVFGFMTASAVLSMWISNAGTTIMLLPIAMAVLGQTDNRRLESSLLLGIAYAASVGGIGTPIGTPPNLVFMQEYARTTGVEPAFTDWMMWTIPIVVIMIPIMGFWLTRGLSNVGTIELPDPGKWRAEEVRTLLVFAITATLWITRKQPFGGWSGQFEFLSGAQDFSVGLLAVVAMFIIPNGKGEKLLDWETAATIPWGILILFGGGITIARAFESSGLSQLLGGALASVGTWPVLLLMAVICLAVTFLTEVTSNTATTTLLMPILAAAAVAADIEPKIMMVPATISASFAFMLPVATPPNAIVFGSKRFTVKEMAREGLMLNLIGVLVVPRICYVLL
ncbi:MAG: SLC13 family permease, partial [Planctomycetota bacterium]